MTQSISSLRSLNTRVTLLTLLIFVASIWSLAFYAGRTLQEDVKGLLGAQQFSAVSLVAAQIEQEVGDRLKALETVAQRITPSLLTDHAALQKFLADREIFQKEFNVGAFVTDRDGTAVASIPTGAGRVGSNFIDSDAIAAVLKENKASIGRPVDARQFQAPNITMGVPIRDAQGRVIGALAGVSDLGRPNFLDAIAGHRYGKTGGYVLISSRHKLVVTATDKRLSMMPTRSTEPLAVRFREGYEGSGVFTNPFGIEMLSSAKGVPSAGWYLTVGLPIDEAFAPIRVVQQRIFIATLFLTLFAGVLTWWSVRRQLAPMRAASKTLANLSDQTAFPQALPVARADEVGALMGSFNRLLATLRQRDANLRESEESLATTLQSIGDAVIATDTEGRITRMNPTAERLTGWPLAEAAGQPLSNVFHIISAQTRLTVANPVQRVMEHGQVVDLANHTVLLARDGREYQIADSAAPIRAADGQMVGVVLVFSDVTEKYRVQQGLRASEQRFRDLVDSTDGIVWEADATTFAFNSVSHNAQRILGYPVDDWLLPGFWVSHIHEDDREQAVSYCAACTGRLESHDFEYRFIAQDGRVVWLRDIVKVVVKDGQPQWLRGLMIDITEQKRAQEFLQSLLKEKVVLLNEVHHRVKNNLQVITSLLRLESGRSSEPGTQRVLQDMQGRIRSMALLHETLYRTSIFASVDLGVYLRQLSTQAFRTLAPQGGSVRLQLDLAAVHVSMDQATPFGLLVNELLANCLKHGFPEGHAGAVCIELKPLPREAGVPGEPARWRLCVSDTGVGFPPDFDARRMQSLGLQLVADLVLQLGATLEIGVGPQAVFAVDFTVDKELE
ncbi:PAS domain S-box protein [Rhodoferax sp.]|uniref:PAS domain S-box protein n=1 Tax=Rhodoferax sp. TaxID=50421 RepID=UPI001ECA56D7|nr:PAS domain S-box protein [Rhodoferax sp.]MBT9507528.1 PAS domain S-box protein [Rhodoferax sp.]